MSQLSNIARAFGTNRATAYQNAVHILDGKQETWADKARLNWEIIEQPVLYKDPTSKKVFEFKGRKTLCRSDDGAPLAVVSDKYKVVQPKDILEFFAHAADMYGFQLEMAGQALGGRRFWGLARTPFEIDVDKKGDKVSGFLLLLTGVDGGLSTQGIVTSIRLWCLNQLPMLLRTMAKGKATGPRTTQRIIKVPHHSKWEAKAATEQLKLIEDTWKSYTADLSKMRTKKITDVKAFEYFHHVAYPRKEEVPAQDELRDNSVVLRMINTYHNGEGQQGIKGTVWGCLNAVTRFIDHDNRARDGEARINRSWLGEGMRIKERAYAEAMLLL